MKTRFKIIILLVGILCTGNVWAAGITYVKDMNNLTPLQTDVLEYSRKLLSAKGYTITLPTEVFSIVGDMKDHECPKTEVHWDNAHFKIEKGWKCTLVIPMTAKTAIGKLNSALYVRSNAKDVYYRIVITTLPTKEYLKTHSKVNPTNPIYSGYIINSNVEGVFIRAFYYDEGKQMYQIEGLVGNNGIIDSKRGSRYEYNGLKINR